jgi:heptosyltransferase-2
MSQARLAVRLPNHLGDACMALPALELLAARCNPLTLVGKPWAAALFEGHGWPVVALHGDNGTQRTQLREAFVAGTPMLLLTNSFSTAMDARLAKLKPIGFATDGRGLLLHRAIPVAPYAELHMVAYYRALAATLTGATERLPLRINLRVSEAARARALALLAAAGVAAPFVVLCPVAIGLHHGKVKAWDGFGRLATDLQASGQRVVAMPGPGETDAVRAAVPTATVLPESDVGTFAAVLAQAALAVANDSGAGHVAAAVNVPLLSIFGVTDPARTQPWGPHVVRVGGANGWPDYASVRGAAFGTLGIA